ncbi:MAG: cardiolipin synthase [Pseudomonadota bacterium]
MKSLWTAFNYLGLFIGIFFTVLVLSRRRRSIAATWAWILTFFALPFVGPLGYLLVGYSSLKRRLRPKPEPQKRLPETGFLVKSNLSELDPLFVPVSQLAEHLSGFPPVSGNDLLFFEGQESIYQALTQTIEKAEKRIYLEYYIFRPDPIGLHFRDLLIQKAREGIEVKLLVDHLGSFSLNKNFLEPLKASGAEVSFFGRLEWNRPWGFQLRNHRKIAVIDGNKAFTGSQNICSDYRKWRIQKLDWIDNQVFISGPGAVQLETVFLEDWAFSTGTNIETSHENISIFREGSSIIQLVPTGPDELPHAFEKILMALIHAARKRITLLTPYFMPTESIALSLEAAARRGVQVEILVPRKSDHWLVDSASKSWYWDLLQGGIHIWETTESFIHAKQVTIDGQVALIGSANMDERSFRLNFECSSLIFDEQKVTLLEQSFSHRLTQARAFLLEQFSNQNILARIRDGLFRLVAPLL